MLSLNGYPRRVTVRIRNSINIVTQLCAVFLTGRSSVSKVSQKAIAVDLLRIGASQARIGGTLVCYGRVIQSTVA